MDFVGLWLYGVLGFRALRSIGLWLHGGFGFSRSDPQGLRFSICWLQRILAPALRVPYAIVSLGFRLIFLVI